MSIERWTIHTATHPRFGAGAILRTEGTEVLFAYYPDFGWFAGNRTGEEKKELLCSTYDMADKAMCEVLAKEYSKLQVGQEPPHALANDVFFCGIVVLLLKELTDGAESTDIETVESAVRKIFRINPIDVIKFAQSRAGVDYDITPFINASSMILREYKAH